MTANRETTVLDAPDREISVREAFGIDVDMTVPAFSMADERVPDLDSAYVFTKQVVGYDLAAFFQRNSTVLKERIEGVLQKLLNED